MWLNTCLNCLRPFTDTLRKAYCPGCATGRNPELCESDCAIAGVDTPAIVKRNGAWYCGSCAETHSISTNTVETASTVLTNQLMHSLTANYLVANLDS